MRYGSIISLLSTRREVPETSPLTLPRERALPREVYVTADSNLTRPARNIHDAVDVSLEAPPDPPEL